MCARSTLFTLFAEFLHQELEAPVARLVRWMRLLGFSEAATRAAISRSLARGWLSRVPGEKGRYRLHPRVAWQVAQVRRRLYEQEPPWDGRLRLLLYHVPEARRTDRDRFRKELLLLGFGTPFAGVWLSPAPRLDAARDLVGFYQLEPFALLFVAEGYGDLDPGALVQKSYDLNAANKALEDFLATPFPVPEAPEAAFASLVRLVHARRKLLFLDPGLPKALCPPGWPGDAVEERFFSLRQALYHRAAPVLEGA